MSQAHPIGRRHPRAAIQCPVLPLGEMIDVSESGARIFQKGPAQLIPGQTLSLSIRWRGARLAVKATVVRVEPMGLRRREIGLQFVGLTATDRQQLREMVLQSDSHVGPQAYYAA